MTHRGLVEVRRPETGKPESSSGCEHLRPKGREGLELGIRINRANARHHLWNNNGTWFVHYTVYPTPVTAKRVRRSLRTKSLSEAIHRRDTILIGGAGI